MPPDPWEDVDSHLDLSGNGAVWPRQGPPLSELQGLWQQVKPLVGIFWGACAWSSSWKGFGSTLETLSGTQPTCSLTSDVS